jgi:monoamine oxidase
MRTTVYEANPERIGGRCWTLRDFFSEGLLTEHGGAFIDSNQRALLRLSRQLGLSLEVVNGGDLPSGDEVFWFDGAYYTYAEASKDWATVGYDAFKAAIHEASTPAGAQRLDRLSVPEWLDSTPIGSRSRFGRLMLANTVSENGGDPGDQSALDLIYLTGNNPRDSLVPLPGVDEKYHVVGGNDQVVHRMVEQLPKDSIEQGHRLVALRQNSSGAHTLTFETDEGALDVGADYVVLALPFSTLREVDLSRSGLSTRKRRVIDTLGMGQNAKIHVEVARKTWPQHGFSGAAYTDWHRFDVCWDDSVPLGADGAPALLCAFPGAATGRSVLSGAAHGTAPDEDVQWFLQQIDPIFPGTRAAYTGRAYEDHWSRDPWVRGAYSYCRVGQATSFLSIAATTEGHVHFAGEHTSANNQGYLEGAVESGERAAREILRTT